MSDFDGFGGGPGGGAGPLTCPWPSQRGPGDRDRRSARASGGSDEAPPSRPPLKLDPRIRQRLIDVRRSEGRRRLRFVLTVLGILVVAAGAWGLTRSPWLAVRHVRIQGNSHTSTAAILQAAGLAHPRQMVDLGPGAMVRSVDALPWIATTRVQRHWPDAVSVVVTERHAVAAAADIGGGWGLVDPTGRVLNLVSTPPAGLPTLAVPGGVGSPLTLTCPSTPPATTGAVPSAGGATPSAAPAQPPPPDPATIELAGADTTAPAALSNALMVSAALPPALLNQVTTVVALTDGTVQLALSSGGMVELGSPDQLSDKLTALVTVLSKVPVGKGTLNVSVPSAPFLTPPSSCH